MKIELISNWKDWWRMTSVWLTTLGALILGYLQEVPDAAIQIWSFLPSDLKSFLPPSIVQWIGYAILFLGIISRIVKQPALAARKDARETELGIEAQFGGTFGADSAGRPPSGPAV